MKRDFSQLQNQNFDLLVCGGGIYGAWTAYDAALRGLKVALIDQGDWASAASSASSNLIHGGLRYLEAYDFKLVKKALTERERLLRLAPHRVWPLRFGVPIYTDTRVGTLKLKAGLTLYDLIAGRLFSDSSHHHFNRDTFAAHFPFLATRHLKSGFTYADAQTDDARLVLELVAGAQHAGAVCVNYCKLTDWIKTDAKVCGAHVEDCESGAFSEVTARQIANTIGQWATTTTQGDAWCRLAKGIHLVLPGTGIDEALLLTAKQDGRVFFILPWYGRTLLGTTDTDYRGDINKLRVEEQEITYLLDAAKPYLRSAWTRADVIGSYAGVRVLKKTDVSDPSSASRDWELKTSPDGVHHSIGGKLTSAREDARLIVDAICSQLGHPSRCQTEQRPFPWAPQDYITWSARMLSRAAQLGIDTESARCLLRCYGKLSVELLHMIENNSALALRIVPDVPLIHADLHWSARHEMVVHLDDLLRRRLPLLILARFDENRLRSLSASLAPVLGWDVVTQQREITRCLNTPP